MTEHLPTRRRFLASTLAASLGAVACSGRRSALARDPRGILTVSIEQQASWVRNFNPLLAPSSVRWPTRAGIYEPLFIYDAMNGRLVPWLATSYTWSDRGEKLTFELRRGVLWSDGRPFTAEDVAFTFELLGKHAALDLSGVWKFLRAVEAKGEHGIEFSLQKPFVPGLTYLGHQPIVPKHLWKDVADPVAYPNENPVGTGPFTEIRIFQNQVYELGKNPRYWQQGKPALEGLRFPAYPGNDQATLALLHGEVDWAGNFVPDVERIFVEKDKAHHRYWFPLVGGTVMLYANASKPPFSDARARKAISMALDRELIVKVAMFGYTRPADATGLHDGQAKWSSPKAVAMGAWVKRDPEAANRLLDEVGLSARTSEGWRKGPSGEALRVEINVVTGWSDWQRAAQIIARDLRSVGIEASARAYDFSAFFDNLQRGTFALSLGWTADEPTPYHFYRDLMSKAAARPIGEASPRNWHRFESEEADKLLGAFESATEESEQLRLAEALEIAFAKEAPAIPLFPNPAWAEFNTRHFEGFPSKDEPYGKPAPYAAPECLLVLTRLRPRSAG